MTAYTTLDQVIDELQMLQCDVGRWPTKKVEREYKNLIRCRLDRCLAMMRAAKSQCEHRPSSTRPDDWGYTDVRGAFLTPPAAARVASSRPGGNWRQ